MLPWWFVFFFSETDPDKWRDIEKERWVKLRGGVLTLKTGAAIKFQYVWLLKGEGADIIVKSWIGVSAGGWQRIGKRLTYDQRTWLESWQTCRQLRASGRAWNTQCRGSGRRDWKMPDKRNLIMKLIAGHWWLWFCLNPSNRINGCDFIWIKKTYLEVKVRTRVSSTDTDRIFWWKNNWPFFNYVSIAGYIIVFYNLTRNWRSHQSRLYFVFCAR